MKRYKNFLPIAVLLGLGLGLFLSGALDRLRPDNLANQQALLQAQIAAHPLLSATAFVAAVLFVIATGIPAGGALLIITGGMLFGIWAGTALSVVGVTLGALILFLASRHAFGDHRHADAPGLVQRLRGGYMAHPLSYTFFLRLVPFFPFGGVTVALAWLRCPLWLFLTATGSGGAVMTGVETALGAGLAKSIGEKHAVSADILAQPGVLFPLLAMGLLALVPVAVAKWRARGVTDGAPPA
ncbi:MAG TPA: VTT domain-containing protein [Rudaea sp.]|jgi:uncharacterized membrane protein YdjX (TVP38/TMEM64 family)